MHQLDEYHDAMTEVVTIYIEQVIANFRLKVQTANSFIHPWYWVDNPVTTYIIATLLTYKRNDLQSTVYGIVYTIYQMGETQRNKQQSIVLSEMEDQFKIVSLSK